MESEADAVVLENIINLQVFNYINIQLYYIDDKLVF